jgi:hypothetical protein
MRAIAVPAMAVVAMAVLAGSASAAHRSAKPAPACRHAGSQLRLADGQAEVYIAPESRSEPERVVYGCAFHTGRSYLLGGLPSEQNTSGGEFALDPTLAGTVVAYEKSLDYETGGGRDVVVVRDLRTGRILHEVLTGTPMKPEAGSEGLGAVLGLVVKSDGAVAWIVATDAENGTRQVHAVDKTGSRTLAIGSNIAPRSLALSGSTLYWTQGGQAQSATLN